MSRNQLDPAARRRTPSDRVEGALLDAARAVLARNGRDAVTVRAVAHEAGVAPMGVYNRFDSKDGLLRALATASLDELREAVSTPRDDDPVTRFRLMGRAYRTFALADPERYRLIFGGGGPISEPDSAASASGHAAFAVLVEAVAELVDGAHTDETVELAQMAWSAIHGAVDLELGGIVRTPDPDATYERLLEMVAHGLLHSDIRRRTRH